MSEQKKGHTGQKKTAAAFFSWQSDVSQKTNRNAIRNALSKSRAEIEAKLGFSIEIDEATRSTPGSPNIPTTIIQKIEACDIFVCDVTTINVSARNVKKKTPNPNVLFELGYAVAHLGWPRIVMLFNTAFGKCKELPFDIDRQRIATYRFQNPSPEEAAEKGALNKLVSEALQLILKVNPAKACDLRGFDEKQEHRKRDVEMLRLLMGAVNWETIDEHFERAPSVIAARMLHFWAGFDGVIRSSQFHIYDKELLALILAFHRSWGQTLNGLHYIPSRSGTDLVFAHDRLAPSAREVAAWDAIEAALKVMYQSSKELLNYIRANYIEIDIDKLSQAAWKDYVVFIRETERDFGRARTRTKTTPKAAPKASPRTPPH